jgi:hypothetical protein
MIFNFTCFIRHGLFTKRVTVPTEQKSYSDCLQPTQHKVTIPASNTYCVGSLPVSKRNINHYLLLTS